MLVTPLAVPIWPALPPMVEMVQSTASGAILRIVLLL